MIKYRSLRNKKPINPYWWHQSNDNDTQNWQQLLKLKKDRIINELPHQIIIQLYHNSNKEQLEYWDDDFPYEVGENDIPDWLK